MSNLRGVQFGSAAFFATALLYLVPQLEGDEGLKTKAYQDVGGVWTICNGETQGVYKGMQVTEEFCRDLTPKRAEVFMMGVYSNLQKPLSIDTFRSHVGFAYNIGLGAYKKSQVLKLTNKGDLIGGCKAMMNWYTAGGRDCRIKSNNCYGVIKRRERERDLCLTGL